MWERVIVRASILCVRRAGFKRSKGMEIGCREVDDLMHQRRSCKGFDLRCGTRLVTY